MKNNVLNSEKSFTKEPLKGPIKSIRVVYSKGEGDAGSTYLVVLNNEIRSKHTFKFNNDEGTEYSLTFKHFTNDKDEIELIEKISYDAIEETLKQLKKVE